MKLKAVKKYYEDMLKAIFSLLLFLFISTHGRQGSYSVPDSGEPICSDGNIMIQSGGKSFCAEQSKKGIKPHHCIGKKNNLCTCVKDRIDLQLMHKVDAQFVFA